MDAFSERLLRALRDYVNPVLVAGLLKYSKDRNHPFEVQFVAGWIATSIFHESESSTFTAMLSTVLSSMYFDKFARGLDAINAAHALNPTHRMTWMESLNLGGQMYLGLSWLHMMCTTMQPDFLQYRKKTQSIIGLLYLVMSLSIYRRWRKPRLVVFD